MSKSKLIMLLLLIIVLQQLVKQHQQTSQESHCNKQPPPPPKPKLPTCTLYYDYRSANEKHQDRPNRPPSPQLKEEVGPKFA